MATRTNAPKGALASAAEVLVNATVQAPSADGVDWVPGTEGFAEGRYGLGKDSEVVSIAGLACKGEDTVRVTWSIFADLLFAKGIKAAMLTGKDLVEETRAEVEDLITVVRYANFVAAVYMKDGVEVKIPAVDDIRASNDRKSIHWKMMSKERRDITDSRVVQIRVYMNRLIEQLRALNTPTAKGKQTKGSIESQYLEALGPVLLFLQKIDLTKIDPKFDWSEEFAAINAAVLRAKAAKALAGG
jgi:hypothetical protein